MRHSSYLSEAVPTLARGDVERLLRFVADAEDLGGEEPFTPELLQELGTIVQADWLGYNELDCVRRRAHLIVERPGNAFDDDELTEEEWVLLEEHPICQAHERGDFRTLKLSDFLTRRELLSSQLYSEWLHPYDIEHELELAIPSPQWHTRTFVFDRVGRGSRDFSERDRLALDLLKPHLTRLWEKAAERKRHAAVESDAAILTAREREVLSWVARGRTNPQIAEILWLSPATVRKHLENVYEKLEVNTRTAAVARFLGLVDGQEPDTVSASVQR
jgi:DNA-binding CsgD family transcriptional regulator